jgi:hypothetical protein
MSEIDNLEWHHLVSSNLKSAAFDAESDTLYVKFKNDDIYAYDNADVILFDNLLDAGSPGSYFSTNIRGLPTRKLT